MAMWAMTVICCWNMVSQSTNLDVGDDNNMFLGPGQTEYQCGYAECHLCVLLPLKHLTLTKFLCAEYYVFWHFV